jgi:crossover junction endodeoxyribonuclease RusA
MSGSVIVEVGWPDKRLSPNGPQRNRAACRRVKAEARNEAYLATVYALNSGHYDWHLSPGTIEVTIVACPSCKRARDDDNLIASCKAFLDGIARRLGVNDALFAIQPVQWREPDSSKPACLFFVIEGKAS